MAKDKVKIMLYEKGTTGLTEYDGFISEAYNTKLNWPGCYPLYNRLRRSNPEVTMVRQAFTAWARQIDVEVDLPDKPTDDDKRYQEFVQSVFEDVEGGTAGFMENLVSQVPFMGWGWWSVVPGYRDPDWIAPGEDDWRSEYDDNLVGLRRLAWRDQSSFDGWLLTDNGRVTGFKQTDWPNPTIELKKADSLHITYGDGNNPEGLAPLEAVWRLERLKYGFEVVMGIGFEHASGHLSVKKTEAGTLSDSDKGMVERAAKAILAAQQGNYALWPKGLEGEIMDVGFSAAPALLKTIQYYSVMTLGVFIMQWIALNALVEFGSNASMTDSTELAIMTFNSMMDGFANQVDAQLGRKLYAWNAGAFPELTRRPKIRFTHINKAVALNDMGQFLEKMKTIMPITVDDIVAVRKRSGFLPETYEDSEIVSEPGQFKPPAMDPKNEDDNPDDPEQNTRNAQVAQAVLRQALELSSRSQRQ